MLLYQFYNRLLELKKLYGNKEILVSFSQQWKSIIAGFYEKKSDIIIIVCKELSDEPVNNLDIIIQKVKKLIEDGYKNKIIEIYDNKYYVISDIDIDVDNCITIGVVE